MRRMGALQHQIRNEAVEKRLQIVAITEDGGSGRAAPSIVERSITDLLRVVRELLNIEMAFVGAFCVKERRFRPVPSDQTTPTKASATASLGAERSGAFDEAVVFAPVQYQGTYYGTLYGFCRRAGGALDVQGAKRLKIAAESTARLLAQADGHDIAVGSAMALRSHLVNRM